VGFLLLGIHVEEVANLMPLTVESYHFFRNHTAVIQSFGVVLMMSDTCLSPYGASEGEPDERREEAAVAGDKVSD
jgi:hypothetical protein